MLVSMGISRAGGVDPVFAEVAKSLLGEDVDVRELYNVTKSMPDTPDVSTPGGGAKKKKGAGEALGGALALGTAAEASGTYHAAKEAFPGAMDRAARAAAPVTHILKPILTRVPKLPAGAGGKAHFALQATNFGVGLTAAHHLLKKPKQPVAKRLVPVPAEDQSDFLWSGEIAKCDTDKRQVFGWCSLSTIDGKPVVDLQGDYVPIEEIEKSAYRYVLESRKGGDMHKRVSKVDAGDQPLHTADLVESFVVTPEKLEKMGLPSDALPLGWWVGFKVHDEKQWEMVKNGERAGFSIHGTGQRRPLEQVAKKLDRSSSASRQHYIDTGRYPAAAESRIDRAKRNIRARADNARNPAPVRLRPVKSSAVRAVGYQKPTRTLAVEMNSRPGAPYDYKASPRQARELQNARSAGSHYARNVRGQYPRKTRLTPVDRARLFAHKPKETVS